MRHLPACQSQAPKACGSALAIENTHVEMGRSWYGFYHRPSKVK
jgi:hypothetical protein